MQTLESNIQGNTQGGDVSSNHFVPQHNRSPNLLSHASEDFTPPPYMGGQKRAHGTLLNDDIAFSNPQQRGREGPWTPQDAQRQAPSTTAQVFREPVYSNGLQPTPEWKSPPESFHRQGSSFDGMIQGEHVLVDHTLDWDEKIIDG